MPSMAKLLIVEDDESVRTLAARALERAGHMIDIAADALPGQERRIIGNDRVKVNCAWNGIALSGANNALTALSLYG